MIQVVTGKESESERQLLQHMGERVRFLVVTGKVSESKVKLLQVRRASQRSRLLHIYRTSHDRSCYMSQERANESVVTGVGSESLRQLLHIRRASHRSRCYIR